MAADREPPTTTDYVVTALSPVLIMLMVGSLVFFLVEVMYEGKYSGRLLYTLFFFVLAAVLVARIAIEADAYRASAYGLILGIVTYLALLSYVEYPGGGWLKTFGWLVNLGLMMLIWWSANKLTWDCTHLDEKRKGAGRGLLSAAGLDVDAREAEQKDGDKTPKKTREAKSNGKPKPRRKSKKTAHDSRLWDWIDKYKEHREAQRQGPHTPGVWVIYFALAALPLFALGQSLVDPADDERRWATFLQMVVYVGSALALLVTTSFLGLRRYLRQRKAKIPASMTLSWLGFGGLLVVVFLALGAFLPRPHSEVPWFGIPRASKSDREASRYAFNKSAAGKGEGTSGQQTKAGDGSASGKNGNPGGRGKAQKGSGGKGQKGSGKSDQNDKSGSKPDARDANDRGQDKQGEKDDDDRDKDDSEKTGKADKDGDEAKGKGESKDGSSDRQTSSPQLSGVLEQIARIAKWIVFAIVAFLVVAALALAILRYLAPFTQWAQRLLDALRKWWEGLFSRKRGEKKTTLVPAGPLEPIRPPPFYEFSNPFEDGSAERRERGELIDYTFLALDSWAWDRDCGRDPNETPLEFCSRLADAFPEIAEILNHFARCHTRATYSDLPLAEDTLSLLEATWEGMVHGVAAPG